MHPQPHGSTCVCCVQVELHQENNGCLAYWLTNTVTLLFLMQKNIKPASGGGYAQRLRQQGQQVTRWGVLLGGLGMLPALCQQQESVCVPEPRGQVTGGPHTVH